jgi:hypothetical protein
MGSKILVTIQIEEAAKALGDMNPIPLWELDEEQFFSLFMINTDWEGNCGKIMSIVFSSKDNGRSVA